MDLEHCYQILSDAAVARGVGPIDTLEAEETAALLDLARVAAHAVERKAAPLVCFSVGRALAETGASDRLAAIRDIIARIETAPDGASPAA